MRFMALVAVGCLPALPDVEPPDAPAAAPLAVTPASPATAGTTVGTPVVPAPDCTLLDDGSWPPQWTACAIDDDCTEVIAGRCPCDAGGLLLPIAVGYAECAAAPIEPVGHVCPQIDLCDDLVPLCVSGTCTRG